MNSRLKVSKEMGNMNCRKMLEKEGIKTECYGSEGKLKGSNINLA